jgi:hypothetical protein
VESKGGDARTRQYVNVRSAAHKCRGRIPTNTQEAGHLVKKSTRDKWFALAVISFFILMATLFIGSLILGGMIK